MQLICIFIAIFLIGIDQVIKIWAYNSLMPISTMDFIPGLFKLTYVENYGAAFSILQNKQLFLIIVTGIVLLTMAILMFTKKFTDKFLLSSFTLILAGGIGNLIDRIFRGFVIDYMEFVPFTFPVFNFADCCVVIGTILFMIYIVLSEIREKKNKEEKVNV